MFHPSFGVLESTIMFSINNNIFSLRRKIVVLFLVFSTLFNLSLAERLISACKPPVFGARAQYYEYSLNDAESFKNPDFLLSGYNKNIYLGLVDKVTNITWDSGFPAVVYPYGFEKVQITNFLMTVTAYYGVTQSGYFSISLQADNFAALFFGKNSLTAPCDFHDYDFTPEEFLLKSDNSKTATYTIYLEYGRYYPIKIIYVKYKERGLLSVNMIKPDGTVDAGLTENLLGMPRKSVGPPPATFVTKFLTSTVSSLPDLTNPTTVSTSTFIHWVSSSTIDVDVIYYVDEQKSTTIPTATTETSVSSTFTHMTPVTSGIGPSTTTDISVTVTSSYITLVTGNIGSSTTTDISVPVTSTYTTLVTGSFGYSSPQVFFNFDVEVEVRY